MQPGRDVNMGRSAPLLLFWNGTQRADAVSVTFTAPSKVSPDLSRLFFPTALAFPTPIQLLGISLC